jgi:hypothetical protein
MLPGEYRSPGAPPQPPLRFDTGIPEPALSSPFYDPAHPIPVRQVVNCDDDGPGSLRAEVASAMSGATIDLTQLACSTITLGSEIKIPQSNLRLAGPGADQLTIDGGSHTRIFNHYGGGQFAIYDTTIANGYVASDFGEGGGCITSTRSVSLVRSTVSNCHVRGMGQVVMGGGIRSESLELDRSNVLNNSAYGENGEAAGGGVYTQNFIAKYSSVIANSTHSPTYQSHGGGVRACGDVSILHSTISGNLSSIGAAMHVPCLLPNQSIYMSNSTVSSNIALSTGAGVVTEESLTLFNSTIVLNTSRGSALGAGILGPTDNAWLALYSSIVAGNGGPDGPGDIANFLISAASNNLIISTSNTGPRPEHTIHVCPKNEPLANNGCLTLTHALSHDSPAIDQGFNPRNLTADQRLATRVVGAQADIGSVERQSGDTDERIFVGGFDGLCDQ